MVNIGFAMPEPTTLTGTPALMSGVPWVCRRSCSRIFGTSARLTILLNVCEIEWGWIGYC